MASKPSIRRSLRAIRDAVTVDVLSTASARIQAELLALPPIVNAHHLFVYVSARSEVHTHSLLRALLARGHVVSVPLIVGEEAMIAREIRAFEELRLGEFGILAPDAGPACTGVIDVAICPGVAFTERGERLGSGRGFYDRFLARHRPRLSMGLALECQLVPELPCDVYDRPMDLIVTERRVLRRDGSAGHG